MKNILFSSVTEKVCFFVLHRSFIERSNPMGLGPSTKMTSLYHCDCPLTQGILQDDELKLVGVVIAGVSEGYNEKRFTAQRIGNLINAAEIDGGIVVTDGWGNHHIDFVSIIDEFGKRRLPSVGLSFFGLQGKLVYDSPYLDVLIDFNKGLTGYESCVVGENHIAQEDVYKTLGLLKHIIAKNSFHTPSSGKIFQEDLLSHKHYKVNKVVAADYFDLKSGQLVIDTSSVALTYDSNLIHSYSIQVISPRNKQQNINSILDFSPIMCKESGSLGQGVSRRLNGVSLLLTGVEVSGFQPANIGSSEGILSEQVVFNTPGTPKDEDYLIHFDVVFQPNQGRTINGIREAHRLLDSYVNEIRKQLHSYKDSLFDRQTIRSQSSHNAKRVLLVKVVSGLGNMYDTSVFPIEPAGYLGSYHTMQFMNMPVLVSAPQILDGVIHSLV